ncbi:ATP synthase subunit I [Leptothoe spongobia TAU-MAC 1115]|uniref:ATP synthase subunit I n=1 Tax=Leptothoe spongobia TAU-MAC 1115 TaxID=1967444 RepID=A0A947DDC7_9CYAN|nr:ATP synthase subunit I [Leptothoe spongobia TAU-MAC 1115]
MSDGHDSADIDSDEPLLKGISPEPDPSIEEYYQLQQELVLLTLFLAVVIFVPVWMVYSLNIAFNCLIGACVGVVYLKMLAKGVEQLGRQKAKVGKNQLALFIGLILVASQLEPLHIIPIFLGFLTYKVAIIVSIFRSSSSILSEFL